jgi:hypothetical protein
VKILNSKKTHFVQPSKDGRRYVEFGTVNEVQAVINSILDAKQEKESNERLQVLETKPSGEPNH